MYISILIPILITSNIVQLTEKNKHFLQYKSVYKLKRTNSMNSETNKMKRMSSFQVVKLILEQERSNNTCRRRT